MTYYLLRSTIKQNFSPIVQTIYKICINKFCHFLAYGGLTTKPTFTKRKDDLVDSDIYTIRQNFIALCQPRLRYPLPISCRQKNKQVCQLSGLAYIPTCLSPIADHRETQIVYNTGRHRPCSGLFLTQHTVRRCPAKFVAPG